MTAVRMLPAEPISTSTGFGALRTDRGGLPLEAVTVRARIDGLFVETTVDQTFVNAFPDPLEATYIFPLPDRAAVTGFRLTVGDRVVEGELCERATAREKYDQAIAAGQRAAIAEEDRADVFTVRVGNLPAGSRASVRLTLSGPVPVDAGEATWRFPLVVAPRYIPGVALSGQSVGSGTAHDTDAVPDASRITPPVLLPGFPNPVRLSLEVELRGHADPRVSLHSVARQDANGAVILTLQPGERLDRDFVLRFNVASTDVQTSLQVRPDDDGKGGTFAMTIVPPFGASAGVRPRDIAFLLDRSGSMGGWKMVAARRALMRMIDTLTPADRFTILAFDDSIETPSEAIGGWLTANDGVRLHAGDYLSKIEARGGTELLAPLDQAVRLLQKSSSDRERLLVLVTDGQVGNEPQIIAQLAGRLGGIRVFTLGIDQAVNEAFLRQLAQLGGGYCEVVESESRLDAVTAKIHRRLGTPVLTKLVLDAPSWKLDAVLPQPLPDLFAGSPLVIQGRYRGRTGERINVLATDDAGVAWRAAAAPTQCEIPALTHSWARARVRNLEDAYTSGDHSAEKDLLATSLKFGVLCRFTAWLAVDVQQVVETGGTLRRVTQPVEVPAGWSHAADFDAADFDAMERHLPAPMAGALCMRLAAPTLSRVRAARFSWSAAPPDTDALCESLSEAESVATPTPVDLTVYRQRARELADKLPAVVTSRDLSRLALRLDELLDDLRSVGASDAERKPLDDLLRDLRSGGEPSALATKAKQVLTAFAGAVAKSRWQFWK